MDRDMTSVNRNRTLFNTIPGRKSNWMIIFWQEKELTGVFQSTVHGEKRKRRNKLLSRRMYTK